MSGLGATGLRLDVEFPRVIDNIFDSLGCREQDRPMHFRGVPLQTYDVLFPSPVPVCPENLQLFTSLTFVEFIVMLE
jgi:hypothetical protein